MNEDFLRELRESAEDTETIENNMINVETAANNIDYEEMEEFLKRKFLEYSQENKSNSTKKGNNPKAIKARRKKNKNKKTHRR